MIDFLAYAFVSVAVVVLAAAVLVWITGGDD